MVNDETFVKERAPLPDHSKPHKAASGFVTFSRSCSYGTINIIFIFFKENKYTTSCIIFVTISLRTQGAVLVYPVVLATEDQLSSVKLMKEPLICCVTTAELKNVLSLPPA